MKLNLSVNDHSYFHVLCLKLLFLPLWEVRRTECTLGTLYDFYCPYLSPETMMTSNAKSEGTLKPDFSHKVSNIAIMQNSFQCDLYSGPFSLKA